ncbi:MAG: flagellar biosynthetic protein FliO [Clostridia bacterium]|nr:flagellar biosynthetic protein FliO [Clostridia bacterium]
MFFQVVGVLLAFGSILFLAVIFTRLLAGKTKRAMKGQYINIVETVSLGLDKQIHLLKVDNQFVLIATAGKTVEFLTTVTLDNYEEDETQTNTSNVFDFKALFDKYIQAYKEKKTEKTQTGRSENRNSKKQSESDEDIASPIEGETFKSNLDRLRSMTNLMYKQGKIDGDDGTNEK